MQSEPLKYRFLEITQVAFGLVMRQEMSSVSGDHLKDRFLDRNQVAIWAVQEAQKKFAVPGDYLKHRFLELPQE